MRPDACRGASRTGCAPARCSSAPWRGLGDEAALCSQPTIARLENLRALLRMGRAMVALYCAPGSGPKCLCLRKPANSLYIQAEIQAPVDREAIPT